MAWVDFFSTEANREKRADEAHEMLKQSGEHCMEVQRFALDISREFLEDPVEYELDNLSESFAKKMRYQKKPDLQHSRMRQKRKKRN